MDKKLYVLVYAPNGIVGQDGSSVRIYDTYEKAYKVMHKEAMYDCEHGYSRESAIEEWHATNDCYDPNAAEWHIYEHDLKEAIGKE